MAACGKDFTLAVDRDGVVRGTGCNFDGQLGWPYPHAMLSTDERARLPETRAMLTAGVPIVMQEAAPRRAVFVAAGESSSCVIQCDGSILASHGGCWPRALMTRTVFASPVVSVACGKGHMVAVTLLGRVHTCGAVSFGQCGRGEEHAASAARPGDEAPRHFVLVEPDDDAFNATTFVFAAAGDRNSSCVGSDGTVWTFGGGNGGVNGLGDNRMRHWPTRIPADRFENKRVVLTSVGSAHAAAVTADGTLFTWGFNSCGQLGVGSFDSSFAPRRLVALQDHAVRTVACGSNHTLAATEAGDCWLWGWANDGRLPGRTMRRAPHRLRPMAAGATVVAVAAGHAHCAALTGDGRLFTWGLGTGVGAGYAQHNLSAVERPYHVGFPAGIGRWHDLSRQHMEAFAMRAHGRLGDRCTELSNDVIWRILQECVWRPEGAGPRLEGVRRLMGAGDRA